MRRKLRAYLIYFLISFTVMNCSTPSESENRSPNISSLTASSDSLEVKETSTLTCVANDPDGDELEYVWSADGGSLNGSGQSVLWIAPDFSGPFSVTCTVDDGNGLSDFESVLINVIEPQIPIIGTWQSTSDLAFGRAAHSTVAYNGYIYV